VFVIDKDNKVEKRMVTTGASYKQQWIVEKGAASGGACHRRRPAKGSGYG
jgi:multidrug efflux pump subunit AcrA (membrane-fusion protein)